MKNNETKNRQKRDQQLKKIRDMYIEIIKKLFSGREGGKQRCIYNRKVGKVGMKKFLLRSQKNIGSGNLFAAGDLGIVKKY